MAKEAYYFSHDSNARNDEKILSLRMDLGMEGYGIYWSIVEMLRDANNYTMRTHYERIAFELHTESEKVRSVINDYDLFIIDGTTFYSESLKTRMKKKEEKSLKASESAKKRWSNTNAMRTHSERNAIKGKESKEKESINIPTLDEFISYAKENELYRENLLYSIKAKYKSWLDAGWKDGNNQKIKNWKNKLNNVFPYLKETNITSHNVPIF